MRHGAGDQSSLASRFFGALLVCAVTSIALFSHLTADDGGAAASPRGPIRPYHRSLPAVPAPPAPPPSPSSRPTHDPASARTPAEYIAAVLGRDADRLEQLSAARAALSHLQSQHPTDDPLLDPHAPAYRPSPHFPAPSGVRCVLLPDAFELCEYTDVCTDVTPTPHTNKDKHYSKNTALLFVHEPAPPVDPPPPRYNRWQPLSPSHPWEKDPDQWDSVYGDAPPTVKHFSTPPNTPPLPFGSRLRLLPVKPSDTVPTALGGTSPHPVVWLPSAWFVHDLVGPHLWTHSSSVAFPLLGAAIVNATAGLRLPPVETLVVLGDIRSKQAHWNWNVSVPKVSDDSPPGAYPPLPIRVGDEGEWSHALVGSVLGHIARGGAAEVEGGPDLRPYHGHPSRPRRRGGEGDGAESVTGNDGVEQRSPWTGVAPSPPDGEFPHLAALASRASPDTPLPPVPFSFLLAQRGEGARPGTRVVWDSSDVDDLVARVADTAGVDGLRDPGLDGPITRVCVRRGVVLGERFALISGDAEASEVRELGYATLGVPRPPSGFRPPLRAIVLDRIGSAVLRPFGLSDALDTGPPPRAFANLAPVLAVLKKYNVPFDVVNDTTIRRDGLAGAARRVSQYNLAIVAHGATETNLAWLPRRSVVIEIQPYSMYCPLFTRFLSRLGHSLFTIYSRLKGPGLDWSLPWLEDVAAEALRNGLPPPTSLPPGENQTHFLQCEDAALPVAADSNCYHVAKKATVAVPVHEFEHTLVRALDLLGVKVWPRGLFDLVEGLPQGTRDIALVPDGSYYERRGAGAVAALRRVATGEAQGR